MELNSPKQSFKNSPTSWVMYVFEVIIIILNYTIDFQAQILKLTDILVPDKCIITSLVAVLLITFFIHQLRRKQPSEFVDENLLVFRQGSGKRKALWISLIATIILSLFGIRWFWIQQYNLPGDSTQIRIFVDDFDAKGWEKLNLTQMIKTSLKQELAEVLPEAVIKFLPYSLKENSTQAERLEWACASGASLVIYGIMDDGKCWPNVKICSENVPETNFEDYQTQVSLHDVTENQMENGNYFMLPNRDKAYRFCFLDNLVIPRTNYLTLFSLGMIILFDDIPSLSGKEKLKTAYDIFSKAIEIERIPHDCDLNYCDGLIYTATIASILANRQPDNKLAIDLLDRASSLYAKAEEMDPNWAEAYINWGNTLYAYTFRLRGNKAEKYYKGSFEKYEKAIEIDSGLYHAFFNWGNVLVDYATKFEGPNAEQYYLESFEKFAMAVNYNPKMFKAYTNWGCALGDYAILQKGVIADSIFQESFKKFTKAVEINPNDYAAYNNWGSTLMDYAQLFKGSDAKQYYEESFEKFANALKIETKYYEVYCNWGNSLGSYASLKGNSEYWYKSFNKYTQAIDINPTRYEAFDGLGRASVKYHWNLTEGVRDKNLLKLFKQLDEASSRAQTQKCRLILISILEVIAKFDPELEVYIENLKKIQNQTI